MWRQHLLTVKNQLRVGPSGRRIRVDKLLLSISMIKTVLSLSMTAHQSRNLKV